MHFQGSGAYQKITYVTKVQGKKNQIRLCKKKILFVLIQKALQNVKEAPRKWALRPRQTVHFRNDLSFRNNLKNSFVRRAFFSLIIGKSFVNRYQECHYCHTISTNVIRIQMYRLENNSLYMRILLRMPWVGRCTVACTDNVCVKIPKKILTIISCVVSTQRYFKCQSIN